jgi:hypothetical protein
MLIFESEPLLDDYQSAKLFNCLFVLSQCFGICAVLSVAIWMGSFEDGGFAWSEQPAKQFHYHPTVRDNPKSKINKLIYSSWSWPFFSSRAKQCSIMEMNSNQYFFYLFFRLVYRVFR